MLAARVNTPTAQSYKFVLCLRIHPYGRLKPPSLDSSHATESCFQLGDVIRVASCNTHLKKNFISRLHNIPNPGRAQGLYIELPLLSLQASCFILHGMHPMALPNVACGDNWMLSSRKLMHTLDGKLDELRKCVPLAFQLDKWLAIREYFLLLSKSQNGRQCSRLE